MRKIDVVGTITEIEAPRRVTSKAGVEFTVTTATLEDKSGVVKLSLFEDQALTPKGSKVQVQNGYATSFRGSVQLNVGRYGSLTIVK